MLEFSDGTIDEQLGAELHAFADRLYPICRSITGDGVRQTLDLIRERIALNVEEVPSGTEVFDWIVPREWNIRDAYIRNGRGEKIVDFRKHNLAVLNYSMPISATMSLAELRPHLHSLPDQPDAIPYRTSYHQEAWGFCLPHRQLVTLEEDRYEVVVDSTLAPGHLTYGEYVVPGEVDDEILVSCHVCHPSLSDDNLSGIVVATGLARQLASVPHRFTYRFLFVPGTIGSITWLARNQQTAKRIRHGVVLTCVGDAANFTYKRSRRYGRRLFSLWLRRASVLLPGLQPGGRLPDAGRAWRVSRVPQFQ
jgi:aminopeptidase-like protein